MPGIVSTRVGYTGGENACPSYQTVCDGDGHTEAIQVEFDARVSYQDLIDRFFAMHHPGPAKAQYKSAIWYHNDEQRATAEEALQIRKYSAKFITLAPATEWHDAEEFHQKYHEKTPSFSDWFKDLL